jgi:hypothetical protein
MFRALALLGLAGSLAACDFVVQKAEERAAAEIGNRAADLGDVAMNLDVKLPAELLNRGKFEISGVPMMPGATITDMRVNAGGQGEPRVDVSFSAPTSPAEVKNYFVEQFRAQGIAASLAADVLTGTTREGQAFTMRFAPEGMGTKGTIRLDPAGTRQ